MEDENTHDDEEESMWGMRESGSSSLLPKTRRVHKQLKIREAVLHSRHQSIRLNDMLSGKEIGAMTPSIRKALGERAKFYRRKLTFYEDLGIMAESMTSNEIKAKLRDADLNSSHATSILNALSMNKESNPVSKLSNNF